jgi:shikimate kinase
MPTDTTISRLDLPYKDLVLTGSLGVGKTTIGRHIGLRLGIDFFDLDEEIEVRELMSITKIRELYGDSHLRSLEYDLCRQAALMRRAVVVIPGGAMLDPRNFRAFSEAGQIVCLTCEMGEALRRLHLVSEQHYRDTSIRRRMLSRMRREYTITDDPQILKFDVTHLTVEEAADLLIDLWVGGEPDEKHFHYGPRQLVKPPAKIPVGLSEQGHPAKG